MRCEKGPSPDGDSYWEFNAYGVCVVGCSDVEVIEAQTWRSPIRVKSMVIEFGVWRLIPTLIPTVILEVFPRDHSLLASFEIGSLRVLVSLVVSLLLRRLWNSSGSCDGSIVASVSWGE
ncbi:unnamed protein product [Darwinula stevensoni]|uniref:Uncharacterized protein n=1 Tax=Darwinula stevensoni TaxID=69355 RepID=A0A7R8XBG4_9CRUS|nr:unnamed protein product [Darwinula stevensoni]CAG0891000.1 unnamed protein product [Darwinula stevensoni]